MGELVLDAGDVLVTNGLTFLYVLSNELNDVYRTVAHLPSGVVIVCIDPRPDPARDIFTALTSKGVFLLTNTRVTKLAV